MHLEEGDGITICMKLTIPYLMVIYNLEMEDFRAQGLFFTIINYYIIFRNYGVIS